MNFFIKKNSTLPELTFPLTQKLMEYYNITPEALENVAITFSMTNSETGKYQIANVAANIITETPREEYPDDKLYFLNYRFRLSDTKKVGNFSAQFKMDMLGDNSCGKITIPNDQSINVIITDSIVKTTVV